MNALPKESIHELKINDRALGELVDIDGPDVTSEPFDRLVEHIDVGHDLGADIFWSLFKHKPQQREDVPPSRVVNKTLIDHMMGMNGFENSRKNTSGNIVTSTASTSLLWQHLLSEDVFADAMSKQQQIEELETERDLEELKQRAFKAMGDPDAESTSGARVDELTQQIGSIAESALEDVDGAMDDPLVAASLSAATRRAAEEAQEMSEVMAGYGLGPGSGVRTNPDEANDFLEANSARIREIASLAGRIRGVAITAYRERVHHGTVLTRVDLTKDITKLMPATRVSLSPTAPPYLRALRVAQLVQSGLLGWTPAGDAEKEGPFVGGVDVSGSMTWGSFAARDIVAKAIALGLAQAAHAVDGREYILFSFAATSSSVKVVTSRDDWRKHLEWAGDSDGGGTDFDLALRVSMNKLIELDQTERADLMFMSDGEGIVSAEMLTEWRAFSEANHCRLMYVPVADVDHDAYNIKEVADEVIELRDIDDQNQTDMVSKVVHTWN